MVRQTRRTFLKVSGAALGGIAVGTTVTAAESRERFIVDAKRVRDTSDVEVIHRLDPVNLLVVRGSEKDVKKLGGKYAPDLVYELDEPVEPQAQSATDEPFYEPYQWDKQDQRIPEVHEVTRGEGTRVAIIDSGILETHPDLTRALNTELSRNFTDDGEDFNPVGSDHGTHVAGIVAADDTNELGTVGSAPGTELIACRVFSGPTATFGDILAAVVYSAEIDCDAANLSIGAYPVSRKGNGQFYGKTLNRTTAYARRQGTLLVISAGNASADLQHDGRVCVEDEETGEVECFPAISLPNEAANVMSIAATGPVGYKWGEPGLEEPPESPAFYTNYGTNAIDLAAPGGDADLEALNNEVPGSQKDLVFNTVFIGEDTDGDEVPEPPFIPAYGWKAGTSMAAPQVTGAAALVKSVNPDYNANQVRSALKNAAEVPEGYDKTYYGAGYLDTLGAIQD
ncbi:MAG TPA: S8 family serine peptidase [Halococcus sp.]|nr:S8 family serine peptidase [Halococcus sp.]